MKLGRPVSALLAHGNPEPFVAVLLTDECGKEVRRAGQILW